MIPTTGERFGPYEILGTLGRGGVGEVYRAWDSRLEREVALKLLHDDHAQFGNRERFLIEARAASALNHANICTVFDIGERDGSPYLVMELLRGITLKQRIERGPVGVEELVRVAGQIAAALEAAHALGIIHRDIKPANISLTREADGRTRAKVLDFGLAKLTEPLPGRLNQLEEHLTVVGEAVGTVSYMSPEQARGDELDGRSDLFSLGVVMYEMATRRTPFYGANTALLFAQLLAKAPEPIREWNDSLPRGLEKIIYRLLEKDPERRFQQAGELTEALEGIAAKLSANRWRRSSAPAVALVRVEEPVARPELPRRPEFLRGKGRETSSSADGRAWQAAIEDEGSGGGTRRRSGSSGRRSSGARGVASLETQHHEGGGEAVREQKLNSATSVQLESQGVPMDTPGEDIAAPLRHSGSTQARRQSSQVGEAAEYQEYLREEARGQVWGRRSWVLGGVAAAVLCTAGAVFTVRAAGGHTAALTQADGLMVATVENHTGVQTLDGSIAEGLELALAQNEALTVRSAKEFRTVLHAQGADRQPMSQGVAREVAEAAGARAFVYGDVREGEPGAHSTGAGFLLHVAVLDTASGRELASAEATAERTEQVPGAIDQVALELERALVGEGAQSAGVGRKPLPLAREATGNVHALHAFAVGVQAEAEGRRIAALRSYSVAAATDPGFVQAELAAAWLGRDGRAELAAQQAALRAMDAAQGRSSRTVLLAEAAGELMGRGNAQRAATVAKTLLDQNAHDVSARVAAVRTLRAAGEFERAYRTAQQGLSAGTRDGDLYREAELALISMNRYADAFELEERSAHESVAHPEVALGAAYLARRKDGVTSALAAIDAAPEDAALLEPAKAVYLDNTGQLADGQAAWSDAARAVRPVPGMGGAGEWMMARAALNRAFASDCGSAVPFSRVVLAWGTRSEAHGDAELAAALCGEAAVDPDADAAARAAQALSGGEPLVAASQLEASGDAGHDAVRALLRGMAHLQTGSAPAAAQDFSQVLEERGVIYVDGANLAVAAQLKLGRAYAEAGDRDKSMEAYRNFLSLWDRASAGDRLRLEAVSGAHGSVLSPPAVELARDSGDTARTRVGVRRPTQRETSGRGAQKNWPPTPDWLKPAAREDVPVVPEVRAAIGSGLVRENGRGNREAVGAEAE